MAQKLPLTPSEYYRLRRPEYFSDSTTISEVKLTKEVLAFELSQITTNQKQDEFELLGRQLAEKLICPNLIPQTGPTGGGDGKTDTETYPVSNSISERWFVPENGWQKDEKWAFAISAKKDWKPKLFKDVLSIVGTNRGYTKIYFITNQTPSSKKRKEAEDELKTKYSLEVIILDGKWIIEKIENNKLQEMAVNSLNLSTAYSIKRTNLGKNDSERTARLNEIEDKIQNPNRYFEYDYQLVEDALESAILSRMLEKSKDEVLGKFHRAIRFSEKLDNKKQLFRILYQRAWTHFYWYEDFSSFFDDYKTLKTLLPNITSIRSVELFCNLYISLTTITESLNANTTVVDLDSERVILETKLKSFIDNTEALCSALIAQTYLSLIALMNSLQNNVDDYSIHLRKLIRIFDSAQPYLDYPFETYKEIIEVVGVTLPNAPIYDELFELVTRISQKRNSDYSAGSAMLRRGSQKLEAKYYKESIVYFGKAVAKLAKEESKRGMYLSLLALGEAYQHLSLYWAANASFSTAAAHAFKSWTQLGSVTPEMYQTCKRICYNELMIGRVPSFLSWFELLTILGRQLPNNDENEEISEILRMDAMLSVRLINTEPTAAYSKLPSILDKDNLWNSEITALYALGHTDLIKSSFEGSNVKTEDGIIKYFNNIANQPFKKQMAYKTEFVDNRQVTFSTKILGCRIEVTLDSAIDYIWFAETLLAFLEAILSTSLNEVVPNISEILITIDGTNSGECFRIDRKETGAYLINVNFELWKNADGKTIWSTFIDVFANLMSNNFVVRDHKEYLNQLFQNEEVSERLVMIVEHARMVHNVLGEAKLTFNQWTKSDTKSFNNIRSTPLQFEDSATENKEFDFTTADHSQREVVSVIDDRLWNDALWQAFGFFVDEFGLVLFLGYKNPEAGKKIFEDWIKKYGKVDDKEVIKLSVIRHVDEKKPHTYRVHVSSNVSLEDFPKDKLLITASRFHEMHPTNSSNIERMLTEYTKKGHYRLCPALFDSNNQITPFLSHSIVKTNLVVKSAWQIGLQDLDRVVIRDDDQPIIPNDVINAPVLQVLAEKNK